MERLFGKMPKNEVEEEEYFRESDSEDQFLIQAGPNGWSAVWEDGSSIFEDNKATTNENFKRALHIFCKPHVIVYLVTGKLDIR